MSFDRQALLARLNDLEDVAGEPSRFVVALSGGLDSTVLAHVLATGREDHGRAIIAVYVDHGMHPDSSAWGEHCRAFAGKLGIGFDSRAVSVDLASGRGPEAAARESRYAAFGNLLESGDWLLSAHHGDDQVETLLLNLMRGSGPSGLAGMDVARRLADGWLIRPMLDFSRDELHAYALRHGLEFVEDPSNREQQYDRNYLRHEILPLFESRWPAAADRIRRSATLLRESSQLLADLAELDSHRTTGAAGKLMISALSELPEARQRNLLRHTISALGLPMPGGAHVDRIVRELVCARADAQPVVTWPGALARRYRDLLYLMPADVEAELPAEAQSVSGERITLPGALGELMFHGGSKIGLSDSVMAGGPEIRYRKGGEEFQPLFHRHTKKLKKLLQEEGVVPWMRDRLPLVYSNDRLVAVADLWIAADAASEPGTAIEWRRRPAIY